MRRRSWCPDSLAMLLIGAVAPTALAAGPDRSPLPAHGNWRIANAHIANGSSLPAAEKESWDRAMGQCNATLIVGTGRAGTSFLVALLTRLGLPTGFTNADVEKTILRTAAHAGLEHDPRMVNNKIQCSPKLQIFKSPRLTEPEKVAQWINARNIQVSPGSPLAASPPSPPTPGPCPYPAPSSHPSPAHKV